MKKMLPLVFILISIIGYGQEEISFNPSPFDKIIISPKINLVLKKGEKEEVKIVYANVSRGKINSEVTNGRLKIFLDEARLIDSRLFDNRGESRMYAEAEITAYVTYVQLSLLEVRGNQEVTCPDLIESESFILRTYGEASILLDSLRTDELQITAYGANRIKIRSGNAVQQNYNLYGENKVDCSNLTSENVRTHLYGEGRLKINANQQVKVNAFGEPDIRIKGKPMISKGLVIGRTAIEDF